jgi:hypothetical protein
MDGDTALRYSRSRHSQDPLEGSDFARAKRQQTVLDAIKEKALSAETLTNPVKLLQLAEQFNDNIDFTPITTAEIDAGLTILKTTDIHTYSFVLDPSIAGFTLLTDQSGLTGNAYGITPIKGYNDFSDIHKYISKILQSPVLYETSPVIYTYDTGIGYIEGMKKTEEFANNHPYLTITYQGTLFTDKDGIYIYSDKNISKNVLKELQADLPTAQIEKPPYISTVLNVADVTIMFGDYTLDTTDTDE